MKRREFIKMSATAALFLAMGGAPITAHAATSIASKTVVKITLDGGPDFKHLIVPAFDANDGSYGAAYWRARASIFRVNASSNDALRQAYNDNYDEIVLDGVRCGILKSCAWLKSEVQSGNVAIVNNVVASTNRDHYHSKLIMESGSLSTGANDTDISGWGGRAVTELDANVVAVTQGVRMVCNGPDPLNANGYDNSRVISNFDSRDMGLYNYDTQGDIDSGSRSYIWSAQAISSRSLKSYYEAKASEIPEKSPYKKFIKHEQQLRQFGDRVKIRLDATPIPSAIKALYEGNNTLESTYFAKQIRNLYDSFVTQDILEMRFANMEYTGWDSHREQHRSLEPKFSDLFGTNKGLHTLVDQLNRLNNNIYNNCVFVISGEFGRQLKSNGDYGTDHGRGNSMLVIGKSVNGGFYGDPFPEEEIARLDIKNEDINGKTSMFQVYAKVLNWQQSGLGNQVFDLENQIIEPGSNLYKMFTA